MPGKVTGASLPLKLFAKPSPFFLTNSRIEPSPDTYHQQVSTGSRAYFYIDFFNRELEKEVSRVSNEAMKELWETPPTTPWTVFFILNTLKDKIG